MPAKRKASRASSHKPTKPLPSTEINYRSIFENACEGIFQTTPDGKFLAANPAMARILGFDSPEELIRKRTDIAKQGYVRPEIREEFKKLMERKSSVSGFECEVRRKDGSTVWVSETARAIRDDKGKIIFYEGFFEDISERKRAEALRDEQSQLLEMIATDAPLGKILERLVLLIESQAQGMLCSVLLFDESEKKLRHGAAPNLPEAYNKLVDGIQIGPCVGSCGTAAFRKKPVIVSDISTDPLWAQYREVAKKFKLGACWSTPILSQEDKVLGTFAMYYREPRIPNGIEKQLIDVATQIARIAISHKRGEDELHWKSALLQAQVDTTIDGILVVDKENKKILQNRRFLEIMKVPAEIAAEQDDARTLQFVTSNMKNPEQFLKRVLHLYNHPNEISRDELETKDGTIMDRYSAPMRDSDGKYFGRIWTFHDVTERRRAEHALAAEQERFEFVAQATQAAIYDWDIRTGTVWRNETYQAIFGAPNGSDRNWWFKHVHPDDLSRIEKGFKEAFKDKKHFWSDEYRLQKLDGSYATVMDRGYILYDAGGEPLRKIGAMMDITERKHAEQALLESQALHHSFVEHLPASVFRKDYEGRYVFVNSIFCKMKGMKPEEILGKTASEMAVYEQALKNVKFKRQSRQDTLVEGDEHHKQILKTGKSIELEEAYPQPDGSVEYFYVVKSPVFGAGRKVVGSQGFQFDITPRKRAEEELFKSQLMLRTILDTIPQRVFWKDKNSVYVGCNKPLAQDCGFNDPADLIGKDDFATKSAVTAEMYRADDRDVMETRRAKLNYEEPQIKTDGATGWLRTSKVPLFDKDGNVIGVLGTYEDISDRKRLEEQLRQAQKMDAFGQLAAGVAHDFNNILTVIQGNLSLLRMGLNSKTDETSAIDQALAASERAANLTRQLLTFGRRQPLQPKPLDLNDVISNMTKMLQRLIGEHIALEAHYAPGGAPVYADVNMLEQVLINLAVNSRDAMPKGGKLVVEINSLMLSEHEVQATNKKSGDFIRFSVTDNGTGITAENLPHIFEPFFTTKEVGKGTGLGLATVFGIVHQHDGWIKVESEVGKGTTFHVFLPRLAKNISIASENASTAKVRGGNENILLVEDELPVRELMRMLLARAGYKIHEAGSGNEALKLWTVLRDKIDLLVTDMVMPDGIAGHELAEKLRAEKPDLKVIYCSGYSDEMLGENSPLRGNSNFLEKPFEPKKLLQRVRDCLDGV